MTDLTPELLLHHAKRFGTDGVMETGIEEGMSFSRLVKLMTGLDKVEQERDAARVKRGHYSTYRKPRKSAEDRVKKLLGITDEEAS